MKTTRTVIREAPVAAFKEQPLWQQLQLTERFISEYADLIDVGVVGNLPQMLAQITLKNPQARGARTVLVAALSAPKEALPSTQDLLATLALIEDANRR